MRVGILWLPYVETLLAGIYIIKVGKEMFADVPSLVTYKAKQAS